MIFCDDIVFTIVHEFGSVYHLAVSEISFAFSLDHVFGYIEADPAVDAAFLPCITFGIDFPDPDFVAKKSCPAVDGTRNECLFSC